MLYILNHTFHKNAVIFANSFRIFYNQVTVFKIISVFETNLSVKCLFGCTKQYVLLDFRHFVFILLPVHSF